MTEAAKSATQEDALEIHGEHIAYVQRLDAYSAMAMTIVGEVYLIVDDGESDGEHYILLGEGVKSIEALRDALNHMLKQIN